ncbi:aldo/keto reductase [Metabacillus arenae]|uniref:Aldo/keto reductase n=1 Tax=Metabacillus arenae TaxID=2771434 RepID=A0A926N8P0_9BACI|nr:aldo/keto reductase [Metabacillus arenae]MBD1378719.1 aldo/keto reductase [Metabacillus arenae]
MQKRQLGQSDLFVSEIGLGCMSLGKEEIKALSIVDEALDLGINYLDTADLYDFGLNEEFVGKAVKNRRKDVILATKVGNRWEEGKDGWFWDPSKNYIKKAVKDSLRRLQTDYIDLYQLHGGTIEDNIDETIEAFEELKQEGVIRYYGISSIRPNVIKKYVEKSSIVSIMMQYSLLDRRPEEWFSLIHENQVSVIARGPMAKGLLSERPLNKASEKIKNDGYLDYSFQELDKLLPKIDQVTPGHTLTEAAIRYCLQQEVIGAVIPGASKIQQLKENVNAVNASPLSKDEYQELQSITKSSKYEQHRG